MGGSLEFCNTSGGSENFYSYSRGDHYKFPKLEKFPKAPLLVKNDTFLVTNIYNLFMVSLFHSDESFHVYACTGSTFFK